ncbi:CRAL-TRIO domain-containing protein [Xylariaceae sp. FL0594]|nr:CRAL-TRIO domain-containing protein [Xylariaceae sp. FL0594]
MRADTSQVGTAQGGGGGYLGNLTAEQEKKLHQLWALLLDAFEFETPRYEEEHDAKTINGDAGQQQTTPPPPPSLNARELREAWLSMVKHEDPDALLLRFLRARKWDVGQALAMLRAALTWRVKEADVDRIMREGEAWCKRREKDAAAHDSTNEEVRQAREYLDQLRLGKVYMRGEDRLGRPVGYIHVSLHKPGKQSQETIEKLVIRTIETARCLFTPPNESFCVVLDLTGFALSNMEWQPLRFIIRAFEANYPECLGTMLIHNAPWIFSGVWKIIRGLLDPVVASKVDFTRSVADLEKYLPKENIIARVGGADAWSYTYIEPSADEDDKLLGSNNTLKRDEILADRRAIAARFLAATQAWVAHCQRGEGESASQDAAVQAKIRRNEIEALADNYWKLDPYIRSRTLVDRSGVLKPDGEVDLYPDRTRARTAAIKYDNVKCHPITSSNARTPHHLENE